MIKSHLNFFSQIIPGLVGQKMNEFFDLVRPIIEFSFDTVLARSNNIFEVMSNEPIEALLKAGGIAVNTSQQEGDDDMGESTFSHFCKKKLCKNKNPV